MLEAVQLVNKFYLDIPISARIAYIGWFIYMAIYFFLHRYEKYNKLLKTRTLKKKNKPLTMYVLLVLSACFTVYCSKNSLDFSIPSAPGVLYELVGFIMMGTGLLVVMEARACLNGYWGGDIFHYPIDKDNKLVRHGLYKSVRHPMYFGQLLLTLGTVLMVDNYFVLILPIATVFANIVRAKNEEVDLLERFGDDFIDYKNKSDFLIPWIY